MTLFRSILALDFSLNYINIFSSVSPECRMKCDLCKGQKKRSLLLIIISLLNFNNANSMDDTSVFSYHLQLTSRNIPSDQSIHSFFEKRPSYWTTIFIESSEIPSVQEIKAVLSRKIIDAINRNESIDHIPYSALESNHIKLSLSESECADEDKLKSNYDGQIKYYEIYFSINCE